jgi:glycosyltransferase involved in cell wall biosynthesis
LRKQTRLPDEVLVMVRDSDAETWALLQKIEQCRLPIRTGTVKLPGVTAALNTGLSMSQGDIIVFTDDDAAPHPDWVARIEAHFQADPYVGGVGGRDWIYHGEELECGAQRVVGKIQWFGRVIGNHHLGSGGPREVDVLKGVNMSFRRVSLQGIRVDERLRGAGAQVHNELALSLAVKRAGWKLIYDPKVAVDHYPGARFSEQRQSVRDMGYAAYNETLILLEHLSPAYRVVFAVWAVTVGSRAVPGLLQFLRFLPREGRFAGEKLRGALQGRFEAWRMWKR